MAASKAILVVTAAHGGWKLAKKKENSAASIEVIQFERSVLVVEESEYGLYCKCGKVEEKELLFVPYSVIAEVRYEDAPPSMQPTKK